MSNSNFIIEVEATEKTCVTGETRGKQNSAEGKILVLSCEGICIRGEIGRLVANIIAKEESFSRACLGELLTVPNSAIARWIKTAEKVVMVDGTHCYNCYSIERR